MSVRIYLIALNDNGKSGKKIGSGLCNALYQARLTVKRAVVSNGKATIHLTGKMVLLGQCDDPRVGGQLRQTAHQFRTVHSVSIFVNNVPLRKLLGGKGG
jgi:hypothetical protein